MDIIVVKVAPAFRSYSLVDDACFRVNAIEPVLAPICRARSWSEVRTTARSLPRIVRPQDDSPLRRLSSDREYDPSTSLTTPELFDFQINGFAGVDFQSDDLNLHGLRFALDALRSDGVGRIFIAIITDTEDRLCRRLDRLVQLIQQDALAKKMVVGLHLEGPWLSPEPGYRGAHPPEPMRAPSDAAFERLQSAANGLIRLVTLAPEWPESASFIANVVRRGVHVSLGHTNASDTQIDEAIKAGARFCTHLGNGAPLTLHRHDNIIHRLLARDELVACFIPDGIHIPSLVLKNLVRAKPAGKVLFTTDAMAGAAAPPGNYRLGPLKIAVGDDGIAREPGGQFAGSTLIPSRGVELTAHFLGLRPEDAHRYWSEAPAKAFGLPLPASTLSISLND